MISAGTLTLGSSNSLPPNTVAAVNGTLELGRQFSGVLSSLSGTGYVDHSGTGSNTLTVSSGSFAGTIENSGGTLGGAEDRQRRVDPQWQRQL